MDYRIGSIACPCCGTFNSISTDAEQLPIEAWHMQHEVPLHVAVEADGTKFACRCCG